MMIDLNAMATFEAVVRTGSFTAAAAELGLSKSTVSDRVRRLEERLGVRLLQRTTRSLRPTDDGLAYVQRCARVVAEAREADAALAVGRRRPHGTLRITTPRLFASAFLTGVVADYLAAHPDVSVELSLAERVVDLVEEGIDLALRVGRPDDGSLIVRPLGHAAMRYVAAPTYLSGRTLASPDDLVHHRLLVVTRTRATKWPFVGPDGLVAVPVEGRLVVNSLTVARDVALAGGGIAFLPAFLCREALGTGALVAVLQDHEPPPLPICALYPSSRHLSSKVRTFLDLLVQRTADARPWEA